MDTTITNLHEEIQRLIRAASLCKLPVSRRAELLQDDFRQLLLENSEMGRSVLLAMIEDYLLMQNCECNDKPASLTT